MKMQNEQTWHSQAIVLKRHSFRISVFRLTPHTLACEPPVVAIFMKLFKHESSAKENSNLLDFCLLCEASQGFTLATVVPNSDRLKFRVLLRELFIQNF